MEKTDLEKRMETMPEKVKELFGYYAELNVTHEIQACLMQYLLRLNGVSSREAEKLSPDMFSHVKIAKDTLRGEEFFLNLKGMIEMINITISELVKDGKIPKFLAKTRKTYFVKGHYYINDSVLKEKRETNNE